MAMAEESNNITQLSAPAPNVITSLNGHVQFVIRTIEMG